MLWSYTVGGGVLGFIYSLAHSPSIPSFIPPFTHSSIHWLLLSSSSKRLSGVRTVLGSGNSLVNKPQFCFLFFVFLPRSSPIPGQSIWGSGQRGLEHEQAQKKTKQTKQRTKTKRLVLRSLDFCLEGNDRRILSWELVSYEDNSDCQYEEWTGEIRMAEGRKLQGDSGEKAWLPGLGGWNWRWKEVNRVDR